MTKNKRSFPDIVAEMKVFSSVLLYILSFVSLRGESFRPKSYRFNQVQTTTMRSLMKNVVSDFEGARGWIPLGLTDDMNDEFPKRIQILGGTYILWKNMLGDLYKSDWIVTKQLSHTDSSDVTTFPTHTTRDIIWAYLPFPGFNKSFPELPDSILPELNNANRITVTRDLPYSFDFTIENFMDPAHIPFAHHSFQGTREDAGPMRMEILTDVINNHTHCEVLYRERYKSKERPGIVSFMSPIYYNLQIFNQNMTFFIRPLIIIVVPIGPGKTKIFLSAIAPRSFVSRFIPKWWIHAFYLRFLDSDIWIHDQEKLVRCGLSSFPQRNAETTLSDPLLGRRPGSRTPRYSLMTESDRGCIAWRKWWKHHM